MAGNFNRDELVAPAWLDKAFFQRALRSFKRDASIQVTDIQITPGTAPGEHYASIMFRAVVSYSSKDGSNLTLKTILKTVPQVEGHKMEFLKNTTAFQSEAKMYSVILPEMERLLRVAGDSTVFAPPLVYQNMTTEQSPVIVFEDISPDGFQTFNDAIDNWEQVQLIVRRLAKYHALSKYLDENGFPLGEFDSHLMTEMIENQDSPMGAFIRPSIARLHEKMKDWKGFERFHKKLGGANTERILNMALRLIRNPINYRVLNHGDFHAKNMMFRNAGTKDEDLIFIDFQFPYWSTPGLDIAYVFFSLTHDKLVEEHRDDIITVYFEEFNQTLKKVNYKGERPSLLDLKIAVLAAAPLDLMYTLVAVPPRFFNFRDMDFDKLFENMDDSLKDVSAKVHAIPEYREFLLKNLERIEKTGIFEV